MHIISALVWEVHTSAPGKNNFHKGVMKYVSKLFRVTPKTTRAIWTRALDNFRESGSFSVTPALAAGSLKPKRKGSRTGLRKRPWDHDKVRAAIDAIPNDQKKNVVELAMALGLR